MRYLWCTNHTIELGPQTGWYLGQLAEGILCVEEKANARKLTDVDAEHLRRKLVAMGYQVKVEDAERNFNET